MALTENDIRNIAEYVRIGLSDEEVTQMCTDLNSIIETLEPITTYDLEGVEPTFHPIGDLSNVMREDVVGAPFPRECAAKRRGSYLAVSSRYLSTSRSNSASEDSTDSGFAMSTPATRSDSMGCRLPPSDRNLR